MKLAVAFLASLCLLLNPARATTSARLAWAMT
jgi:hypothetical protein